MLESPDIFSGLLLNCLDSLDATSVWGVPWRTTVLKATSDQRLIEREHCYLRAILEEAKCPS